MSNWARKQFVAEKKLKDLIGDKLIECPGIYCIVREEDGIKYCYVGQAKDLHKRLAQHVAPLWRLAFPKQHIDCSIKKHGFEFSYRNNAGTKWTIDKIIKYSAHQLDEMEKFWFNYYAKSYQMLNKTSGSQAVGKKATVDTVQSNYKRLSKLRKAIVKDIVAITLYFDLSLNPKPCAFKKNGKLKLVAANAKKKWYSTLKEWGSHE